MTVKLSNTVADHSSRGLARRMTLGVTCTVLLAGSVVSGGMSNASGTVSRAHYQDDMEVPRVPSAESISTPIPISDPLGRAPTALDISRNGYPQPMAAASGYLWMAGTYLSHASRINLRNGAIQHLKAFEAGTRFFFEGGRLWAANEGWTAEVDPQSGQAIRTGKGCSSGASSMAASPTKLAIGCESGKFLILDLDDLNRVSRPSLWQTPTWGAVSVVWEDAAFWAAAMTRVASRDAGVLLSRIDGETLRARSLNWESGCGTTERSSAYELDRPVLSIANGVLWCGSGSSVRAIETRTGQILSDFATMDSTVAHARVGDRLLLYGFDYGSANRAIPRIALIDLAAATPVWKRTIDYSAGKYDGNSYAITVAGERLWLDTQRFLLSYDLSGIEGFEPSTPEAPTVESVRYLKAIPAPGQVFFSWDAPDGIPTSELGSYEYRVNGGQWRPTKNAQVRLRVGTDRSQIRFEVRARTLVGIGKVASTSARALRAARPTKVRAVQVDRATCRVRVSWIPSKNDGLAGLTGYEYRIMSGKRATEREKATWFETGVRRPEVTINDCDMAQKRVRVSVRAVNAAGLRSATVTIAARIPGKPNAQPAPPPEQSDDYEQRCPLFYYYMDLSLEALARGDVYYYLYYRDLAAESIRYGCA